MRFLCKKTVKQIIHYATTRVEKTPTVQDERGRMQYDERKVAAMPKAPARRH